MEAVIIKPETKFVKFYDKRNYNSRSGGVENLGSRQKVGRPPMSSPSKNTMRQRARRRIICTMKLCAHEALRLI